MARVKKKGEDLKICQIKLLNGDEVIACVHKTTEEELLITHPFKVEKLDTEDGRATVFIRYMNYSAHPEMSFRKDHVIACSEVHQEMQKYYFLSLKSHGSSLDSSLLALRSANKELEDLLAAGASNLSNDLDLAQMDVLSRSIN